MKNIVITTDSGIDPINQDNMIAGQIIKDNKETFRDVYEISSRQILEEQKDGHNFTTSSPIPEDYIKKFEEHLKKGNDIIHLSMSSGISEGSVNGANLIAHDLNEKYENKVHVIDTLNATTGGTLINEYAKSLVEKGYSYEDIISKLEQFKKLVETSFYVPNPEGFIRSGRNKSELCTKDKALLIGAKVSKTIKIKFRVNFNDEGNLYTHSLMRCSDKKGMMRLVNNIVNSNNIENYDPRYVVIGNIQEKNVNMQEIIDYLKNLNYFENVINQDINSVVAAYGSEDLCGISLVKKI